MNQEDHDFKLRVQEFLNKNKRIDAPKVLDDVSFVMDEILGLKDKIKHNHYVISRTSDPTRAATFRNNNLKLRPQFDPHERDLQMLIPQLKDVFESIQVEDYEDFDADYLKLGMSKDPGSQTKLVKSVLKELEEKAKKLLRGTPGPMVREEFLHEADNLMRYMKQVCGRVIYLAEELLAENLFEDEEVNVVVEDQGSGVNMEMVQIKEEPYEPEEDDMDWRFHNAWDLAA